MIRVGIGEKIYEYWIDAAFIPEIKKGWLYNPWGQLHFIKKRCYNWKRIE
jgi:hypothetical protein